MQIGLVHKARLRVVMSTLSALDISCLRMSLKVGIAFVLAIY